MSTDKKVGNPVVNSVAKERKLGYAEEDEGSEAFNAGKEKPKAGNPPTSTANKENATTRALDPNKKDMQK